MPSKMVLNGLVALVLLQTCFKCAAYLIFFYSKSITVCSAYLAVRQLLNGVLEYHPYTFDACKYHLNDKLTTLTVKENKKGNQKRREPMIL